MDEKELLELIQNDESAELECKKSEKELPNDLWKTYSAFANTNGGIILLGVEQKRYNFFVRGVEEPSKILRDFWSIINNINKISANILRDDDIEVVNVDGKNVVKIFVPRAHRRQRPIYLGSNPIVGTYKRNYDGDYKCTEAEVKRLFADQYDFSQDEKILKNYTIEDLNTETLEKYRNRFAVMKPAHPWINLDNKEFLIRIGAWGKDKENNIDGLTIAGLLMFGNEWDIVREVPEFFLDYRKKDNTANSVRWHDRVTSQDGTWSGNLFDFFFRIINKLTDEINIPFKMKGALREDDTEVHKAIREALANALIHADYFGKQGIVIEKHQNYFRFSNPGELRISVKQAIRGGVSDPRNKNLFKMFSLIGIGERAGSGIENIYKVWDEVSFRKPEIIENVQPDRLEVILRTISLLPEKSLSMIKKAIGKDYEELTRNEVVVLVAAYEEYQITNTRIQVLLGINTIEASKILTLLLEKKLIIAEGQGRGTRYLLSDVFVKSKINISNSMNKQAELHKQGGTPYTRESNSINNEKELHKQIDENSINNRDELHKQLLSNSINKEEVESIDLSTLTLEIQENIEKIASKKRADVKLMEKVILYLCSLKTLELKELARILNRNDVGLRSNYLNRLLKENKLKLLYPGQINHPKQAYYTNQEYLSGN